MNKMLEWSLFAFLSIFFNSFSYASDFREVDQSVVRIVSISPTDIKIGTGFVINETQDVVTHYHLITESLKLLIADGGVNNAHFKQALVKWSSKEKDLAILHVPNLRRPVLALSSVEPNKKMPIYLLGFPEPEAFVGKNLDNLREIENVLELSMKKGSINGLMYTASENKTTLFRLIQYSAEMNLGNPGAPLINACGQVVGINTVPDTIRSFTANYPVALATGVFYTSHISYLIDILKAQKIPFNEINNACLLEDKETLSVVYRWIVISVIVLVIIGVIIIRYQQWKPFRPTFEPKTQRLQRIKKQTFSQTMNTNLTYEGGLVLSGFNRDGRIISLVINDIQLRQKKRGLTIGRANSLSELVLIDDTVSRRHARLIYKEETLYIEDLNSLNGTKVDGMMLEPFKATKLNLGQTLRLGDLTLSLRRA